MPLFAVERDLTVVSPEQLRASLQGVLAACEQLKHLGKKVRYISTALFPGEGRAVCLFGAQQPAWVKEANEVAGIPYLRVVPVLDLTPAQVRRDMSRRRPFLREAACQIAPGAGSSRGIGERGGSATGLEVERWMDEGRRLFGLCLQWLEGSELSRKQAAMLERENDLLRDDNARLRHENDVLHAQREQMLTAFEALASQMTRAVDHVLDRFPAESKTSVQPR